MNSAYVSMDTSNVKTTFKLKTYSLLRLTTLSPDEKTLYSFRNSVN